MRWRSVVVVCVALTACHSGKRWPDGTSEQEHSDSLPDGSQGSSGDAAVEVPDVHSPRVDASRGGLRVDGSFRQDARPGAVCGDREVEGLEECDDGNDVPVDGCESDCRETRLAHLSVSGTFACALFESGHVKCWGRDVDGFLGRGTTGEHVSDPSGIGVIDFETSRKVVELQAATDHTCVRFDDNRMRCWGSNSAGQLGSAMFAPAWGDSPERPVSALSDVDLDNVVMVRVGYETTCAVTEAGAKRSVYCWGANEYGGLGIGNTSDQIAPTIPVALGQSVLDLAVGVWGACALLESRAVRCWGRNNVGQLGLGASSPETVGDMPSNLPSTDGYNVVGLPADSISSIHGRYVAFCARADTRVWCWGSQDQALGTIGYPNQSLVWSPPGPLDLGFDVGHFDIMTSPNAVDTSGRVFVWGSGIGYAGRPEIGEVRTPREDFALLPGDGSVQLGDFEPPEGTDPAKTCSCTGHRCCAVMKSGAVRCWGVESDGRLGYGDGVGDIGIAVTPAESYEALGRWDVKLY